MANVNKVLTVKELSRYLGMSKETLRKYRMRGIGPVYIKLGQLVRYRKEDVDAWLKIKENRETREDPEKLKSF